MFLGKLLMPAAVSAVVAASAASAQATPADPAKQVAQAVEQAVAPSAQLPRGVVQPEAIEALRKMSDFLKSLTSAELVAKGGLDIVNTEGQRIQIDGTTVIKMKRRGFVIHHVNDLKSRNFYYDGITFTMASPKLGFYATVPAPPTNEQVLETVYAKYGIRLPLEDFFRWDGTNSASTRQFVSAYSMGRSMQDGVSTTHYVFREPELDWEVWLKDGAEPLPVKLSIIDRTNPALPAFTARLSWRLNPVIAESDFTFKPGPDATRIAMVAITE